MRIALDTPDRLVLDHRPLGQALIPNCRCRMTFGRAAQRVEINEATLLTRKPARNALNEITGITNSNGPGLKSHLALAVSRGGLTRDLPLDRLAGLSLRRAQTIAAAANAWLAPPRSAVDLSATLGKMAP